MRPPKQAISPSVVRTLNRPSASGDHHGPRFRPPSPMPSSSSEHEYSNVSLLWNSTALMPSVEKRHVCRLAKPAQNGCGGWFWSLIAIEAGNELVMFRIEIGQSLNTRAWTTALFGSGVANAEAQVRHAPASASARVVIRLMRDVSKAVKVGRLTTRCVTSSQRPGGLRR